MECRSNTWYVGETDDIAVIYEDKSDDEIVLKDSKEIDLKNDVLPIRIAKITKEMHDNLFMSQNCLNK